MDYIYKAVVDRLKSETAQAYFDLTGLKPFAHIDRFKGQYLNPDLHQPWNCPAVFLKFNVAWDEVLDLKQHGNGIMEVHLELENYAESADDSPDQDSALTDYEYQRIIQVLLQGFSTDQFGPFKRVSTDEDDNPTNTNVTIIRYSFSVEDYSAYRFKDANVQKLDDLTLTRQNNEPAPPESNYVI